MTDEPARRRIDEAAQYAGVAPRTVWRWIAAGLVGVSRVGGCTFVNLATVDALKARMETRPRITDIAPAPGQTTNAEALARAKAYLGIGETRRVGRGR